MLKKLYCLLSISLLFNMTCIVAQEQKATSQEKQEKRVVACEECPSKQKFNDFIKKHKLVVVDFYSPGCSPCKRMAPVLEALTRELSIDLLKVNVTTRVDIAHDYSIESMPTLLFFKDGKKIGQRVGFSSEASLAKELKLFLDFKSVYYKGLIMHSMNIRSLFLVIILLGSSIACPMAQDNILVDSNGQIVGTVPAGGEHLEAIGGNFDKMYKAQKLLKAYAKKQSPGENFISFEAAIKGGVVNGIHKGVVKSIESVFSNVVQLAISPGTNLVVNKIGNSLGLLRYSLTKMIYGTAYLTFEDLALWQTRIHNLVTMHMLEPAANGRVVRRAMVKEIDTDVPVEVDEYKFGIDMVKKQLTFIKASLERSHAFYVEGRGARKFVLFRALASVCSSCTSTNREEVAFSVEQLIAHIDHLIALCNGTHGLTDLTNKKDEIARVLKSTTTSFKDLCILIDDAKTFDMRRSGIKLMGAAGARAPHAGFGGMGMGMSAD